MFVFQNNIFYANFGWIHPKKFLCRNKHIKTIVGFGRLGTWETDDRDIAEKGVAGNFEEYLISQSKLIILQWKYC